MGAIFSNNIVMPHAQYEIFDSEVLKTDMRIKIMWFQRV
jgi:hypothetical protein